MSRTDENLEQFRHAVERRAEESREESEASRMEAEQRRLNSAARQPEQGSVRAKNSGHGKKTADKWNQ